MNGHALKALFGLSLSAAALTAQATNGGQIFRANCAACHGADGRGAPDSARGFEPPPTFPDFTDCVATAREPGRFWSAIVHNGGPARGFSEIMPSFREALSSEQIAQVLDYVRGFCREPAWPHGDLNFPRALVTEKAFPEDEMVMDFAVNAEGGAGVTDKLVYEKRLGARGQLDFSLPFRFQRPGSAGWLGGVGDLVTGYKRVVLANSRSGSILSLAGEAAWPTGNSSRGMGKGVTVFESFASFGQKLPKAGFLQAQTGVELPTHTDEVNRAVFWRTVLGKSFAPDGGRGRLWSPMVELLADRELAAGERVNWDVVPQFQVTLSRRQHIRANIGIKLPVNDFGPRSTQILFYLLWDTFDGRILDGWK
ncbi:MAG: cytochrome c [Bryobacterales bacterium]|nr:cytochrome c [Bryobacterales bacterium]